MKEELHQGDILKIEHIKKPVLIVSKDFFNQTYEIIGCPIFEKGEAGPLHIHIEAEDVEGYVQCEKMALLDLNIRGYSKIDRIHYPDIINITDAIQGIFDYIIIDLPPSLGVITINSLIAADSVLIPIQAEYFALEGLADLLNTIKLVETRLRSPTPIKGILLTLYDARTRLGREVYSELKKFFKDSEYIFKTVIPRNVRLAEAPSYGKPCIVYDPESKGSIAYLKLAKEILEMDSK